MVFTERELLGLEISPKSAAQYFMVPCGDHLLPSHGAQVDRLQEEFSNVFSPVVLLEQSRSLTMNGAAWWSWFLRLTNQASSL